MFAVGYLQIGDDFDVVFLLPRLKGFSFVRKTPFRGKSVRAARREFSAAARVIVAWRARIAIVARSSKIATFAGARVAVLKSAAFPVRKSLPLIAVLKSIAAFTILKSVGTVTILKAVVICGRAAFAVLITAITGLGTITVFIVKFSRTVWFLRD